MKYHISIQPPLSATLPQQALISDGASILVYEKSHGGDMIWDLLEYLESKQKEPTNEQ